jgi:predicted RNase H-like nuclease
VSWLAGVDGCRGGWVVAVEETRSRARLVLLASDFEAVLAIRPALDVIAIDIPIGLPDAGPRECDVGARRRLGAGATSRVFPAPARAVLAARTYDQANRLSQRAHGRKISRQLWGILPKIREVDERMTPTLERRVYEVHPELAFMALAGRDRALPPKRTRAGRAQRAACIRRSFPGLRLDACAPPRAKADDVLDAFAALWVARRIHAGRARSIPPRPPRDGRGLRMAIWS